MILKHRFPKTYRHPTLDRQLTKQRLVSESRVLVRAAKAGIAVPALRCLDLDNGVLGLELVHGQTVRQTLGGGVEGAIDSQTQQSYVECQLGEKEESNLLQGIGKVLARLHSANLVHGDLTTSNMILSPESNEIVLIDFGLAYTSANVEDKAVDLFVLERAFLSTHPDKNSTSILRSDKFEVILQGYAEHSTNKAWDGVKRRLDDVRLRGRKRSMVG